MSDEILTVKKLCMYSPSLMSASTIRLLDDINFSASQDDVLGLVGETGGGKSILLNAVGGNPSLPLWVEAEELLYHSNQEAVSLVQRDEDEMRGIWGRGIAVIPPNARDRLNPILRIGDQVCNIIQANLGVSRKAAKQKAIEMFRMVQMPDPEQNFFNYPHELSGGMAQRVVISCTLSLSPRLLLADEPTMGLDVTIQTQVLDLMASLFGGLHSAVILATRDLGIVANYCNKVAALCKGQMVEFANVRDFFKNAKHPYSHYLLEAAFATHGGNVDYDLAKSNGAALTYKSETGCRFVHRCSLARKNCALIVPPVKFVSADHYVRCHVLEDI